MTTDAVVGTRPASSSATVGLAPEAIALRDAWLAYSSRQLQPRVRVTYAANVDRFILSLGAKPIAQAVEADLWSFIDQELQVCGNLRTSHIRRIQGVRCQAGVFSLSRQRPNACRLTCPKYMGRNPVVIHHALKALNSFYRFLVRRGHVGINFVPEAARQFSRDYPLRKFLRPRRRLTLDEVRTLIRGTSHPTRHAFYLLLAKTGFRIHEALLLTVDPACLDFEAKTIRIPVPAQGPNKRRGKRFGFIDRELHDALQTYLAYRDGLLARRRPERRPLALFLGDNGRPVSANLVDVDWLRNDATRLGLVNDPQSATDRVTAHSFRHMFTSLLVQRRCPEIYINHLRGDVIKNILGTYHDPTPDELKAVAFEFMGEFGV